MAADADDVVRRPLRCELSNYTLLDAAGTLHSVPARWRDLTAGVEELPGGIVVALEAMTAALDRAGGDGTDLTSLVAGPYRTLVERCDTAGAGSPFLESFDEHAPIADALETCEELLSASARLVAREVVSPMAGVLAHLNVSDGGVPKRALDTARIDASGVVGDAQRARQHHGRPSQALSIWSTERIEALQSEGHPVTPGAAGENLTVSDLDWGRVRPGVRLVIGSDPERAVVAEVTWWAEPCRTIAGCFSDRRYSRIGESKHPGWSRAYAAVLRGGEVRAGDRVAVRV
jgi:hypothetical protein